MHGRSTTSQQGNSASIYGPRNLSLTLGFVHTRSAGIRRMDGGSSIRFVAKKTNELRMAIPPGQRRKIASDKNELITPQMNTLMNDDGRACPPYPLLFGIGLLLIIYG